MTDAEHLIELASMLFGHPRLLVLLFGEDAFRWMVLLRVRGEHALLDDIQEDADRTVRSQQFGALDERVLSGRAVLGCERLQRFRIPVVRAER